MTGTTTYLLDDGHHMEFLRFLEQSGPIVWLREGGSIWGYPTVLFMHTLGLGTVAGLSSALSLRFLGFGSRIPLPSLLSVFGLVWAALGITAFSGLVLLVADAINKLSSPVFYVKMVFVAFGIVAVRRLKADILALDGAARPSDSRFWALATLLCWVAAITAGRLMAYIGPIQQIG